MSRSGSPPGREHGQKMVREPPLQIGLPGVGESTAAAAALDLLALEPLRGEYMEGGDLPRGLNHLHDREQAQWMAGAAPYTATPGPGCGARRAAAIE